MWLSEKTWTVSAPEFSNATIEDNLAVETTKVWSTFIVEVSSCGPFAPCLWASNSTWFHHFQISKETLLSTCLICTLGCLFAAAGSVNEDFHFSLFPYPQSLVCLPYITFTNKKTVKRLALGVVWLQCLHWNHTTIGQRYQVVFKLWMNNCDRKPGLTDIE